MTTSTFQGKPGRHRQRIFTGELSSTAMVFKIATIGSVKLTVPQLNKIKNLNQRSLKQIHDEVVRVGDRDNARFALSLLLK